MQKFETSSVFSTLHLLISTKTGTTLQQVNNDQPFGFLIDGIEITAEKTEDETVILKGMIGAALPDDEADQRNLLDDYLKLFVGREEAMALDPDGMLVLTRVIEKSENLESVLGAFADAAAFWRNRLNRRTFSADVVSNRFDIFLP